ncbi:V4R domain-containing protein [Methanocaldococcus sp.]
MELHINLETAKKISERERSKISDNDKIIEDVLKLLMENKEKKCIPIGLFKAMVYIAIKKMGECGNVITFYEIGYELGKKLKIDNIEELKKFFDENNLGKLDVVSENPLIIKVGDCTLCSDLEFDEPICHLDAGIIAGALENIYKKVVVVDEFKCMAMGSDACYFSVDIVKD